MEFGEKIKEVIAIPNQNKSPETHNKHNKNNTTTTKLCTTTSQQQQQQSGWSMISRSCGNGDEDFVEEYEPVVIVDQKKLVKLRAWFDRFHGLLLNEISPTESHLLSVPPVLGTDGGDADLFGLFVVVRGKGGRDAVTRRCLWASVAAELGLGRELAAAVKLVYAKYLDAFERWVDRGVAVVRAMEEEEAAVGSRKRKIVGGGEGLGEVLGWVRGIAVAPRGVSLPEPSKWKIGEIGEDGDDEEGEGFGGGSEIWKKVLLAREALFLKRKVDDQQKNQRMHPGMYTDKHSSAYNLRERRQKSRRKLLFGKHDSLEPGSESSPSTSDFDRSTSGSEDQSDSMDSSIYRYSPSRIPVGPAYQAEIPEWTGVIEISKSEDKRLGTKIWPLTKTEQKYLVERDPIGKGRYDSCGCQEPDSLECVRFHVTEKRLRVKRELSSAFYLWRFNRMGEEVRMFWTNEEEKLFKDTVSSNLSPIGNSFWGQIFKAFPAKSRADLVCYYYNVYILSRRAHQNRITPCNINSDDEEYEDDLTTNGGGKETPESKKSILLSPNKQRRK